VSDEYHRSEFHNALEWVLSKGTLNFCGIEPVTWLNFGEAGVAGRERHDEWLKKVKQYAADL
jgi:putative NADPH-quinone reductase